MLLTLSQPQPGPVWLYTIVLVTKPAWYARHEPDTVQVTSCSACRSLLDNIRMFDAQNWSIKYSSVAVRNVYLQQVYPQHKSIPDEFPIFTPANFWSLFVSCFFPLPLAERKETKVIVDFLKDDWLGVYIFNIFAALLLGAAAVRSRKQLLPEWPFVWELNYISDSATTPGHAGDSLTAQLGEIALPNI